MLSTKPRVISMSDKDHRTCTRTAISLHHSLSCLYARQAECAHLEALVLEKLHLYHLVLQEGVPIPNHKSMRETTFLSLSF
jgi:hypothetical protein